MYPQYPSLGSNWMFASHLKNQFGKKEIATSSIISGTRKFLYLNLCHDFSFCSMNYSFVLNYPSVCSYPYLRGSSDIRLGFVHPLVSPVRDCILIFIVALLEWAGMLLNHSLLRSSKNWPISGMFILLKLHL